MPLAQVHWARAAATLPPERRGVAAASAKLRPHGPRPHPRSLVVGLLLAAAASSLALLAGTRHPATFVGGAGASCPACSLRGGVAVQARSGLDVAELAEIPLRRVENGSLVDGPSTQAAAAGTLWAETGAVVHVVRRAGCVACRNEAYELMNKVVPRIEALVDVKKSKVPFVAVVREVAPTKSVKEDAGPRGLGVGEFQHTYFLGKPIYWDEEQKFVKAMGNRRISFKFKAPWWKPWALWSEITTALKKLKDKGVEGNLVGDGIIMGGVIVVGPGKQGITFAHFEENDPDIGMPVDEIVSGVERFQF